MELQEFLEFLIQNLIGHSDYEIREEDKKRETKYYVLLNRKDFGVIVGRGGRTASAIRELVRTMGNTKKRVFIQFDIKE